MRKCKWCGSSGWLLKVSQESLCQKCESEVKVRVMHATRLLNENLNLMRHAKEIDARLERGQLAIIQLRELIPYYEKGLVSLKPSPQELVARIYTEERAIIQKHIEHLYKAAIAQTKKASRSDINHQSFSHVIDAINRYKTQLGKKYEMRWRKQLDKNRGKLLVESAKRDAGRGRRKLAIDQYIEALDMLRVDDTGDPEHQRKIEQIKKRILDLGGKIPESWRKPVQSGGEGLPASNA